MVHAWYKCFVVNTEHVSDIGHEGVCSGSFGYDVHMHSLKRITNIVGVDVHHTGIVLFSEALHKLVCEFKQNIVYIPLSCYLVPGE